MDSEDHLSGAETSSNSKDTKDSKTTWLRGLYMLVFIFAFWVAETLLGLTALFQFIVLLITGERNEFLARFGRSLAKWIAAATRFLTCASEDMPFPWADWPSSD